LSWVDLPLGGEIYSHSRVWVSAAQFAEELPYYVCLVDLLGGPRVAGRLEWDGEDAPEIGGAVEARFDRAEFPFYFVSSSAAAED
jgi:uncharacterized OB-fold protein